MQVRFPKDYGSVQIDGIELVELDACTAGCISAFLDGKGELDLWRTALLGICYRDLAVVNANIDKHVLEYFVRLEKWQN